jgi:hypothetical protein
VSCISGSKSPQPEKRKKGITPIISHRKLRQNPIFMLYCVHFNKNNLTVKDNKIAEKYGKYLLN